ncbi:MAG TPA: alkaline phosphatase family protein [Microbacteriaceae bacterium]
MKGAGLAAAGAVVGGIAGGAIGTAIGASAGASHQALPDTPLSQTGFRRLQPREKPGYDHLVVVMFENRSFDNLLGYLYDETNLPRGEHFDGLAFGDHSNIDANGNEVPAYPYEGETDFVMRQPAPDPGEEYNHVNVQLFNHIDPAVNATLHGHEMLPPFNTPPKGTKATMSGFVHDYINDLSVRAGVEPGIEDYRVVMGAFTPQQLPVFSTLAQQFVDQSA